MNKTKRKEKSWIYHVKHSDLNVLCKYPVWLLHSVVNNAQSNSYLSWNTYVNWKKFKHLYISWNHNKPVLFLLWYILNAIPQLWKWMAL